MLAFFDNNSWKEWTGQARPFGGSFYNLPLTAEQCFSDSELAAYGLQRVSCTDVPAGKQVASWTLEDREGHPVRVDTLTDIPTPHASILSRRQFVLGLYVWQLLDQAQALVDQAGGSTKLVWENASDFYITDPLLTSLVAQLGKADQLQEFFDFAATL